MSARTALVKALVRPVRSATNRRAAVPAWAMTPFPLPVTVSRCDHRVESCTRKVPSGSGFFLTSTLRFSQLGGTLYLST